MKTKTIIIVKPHEGKAPLAWPDQVTMHIRRYYVEKRAALNVHYMMTGFSTLIEYLPTTIIPLDRDVLLDLTTQWRDMYGRGRWDFYLKPEGYKPAPFNPRRKRLSFIEES